MCPGYLYAWFTNLHDFRRRSLVERIFWSLPLSLAVSTISSYLLGKFLSLNAVVVFYLLSAALFVATIGWEWRQNHLEAKKWIIGFRPLGGKALALALMWVGVAIFSLVDIQRGQRLFMSVAMADQGFRADWTESVLHSGVPPANPLYLYGHPAKMRNYYFWYVDCAAIVRMAHLPIRAVITAGCIWAGFMLAAILGLYLKYFLAVGVRLRLQFLYSVNLLAVTGLDICVIFWNLFFFHQPPPPNIEAWSKDAVISWFDTLLWSPNHIAGLVCCTLAFFLAWISGHEGKTKIGTIILIAASLASAGGLSIYVTFAFFLVMVAWALWQIVVEQSPRSVLILAIGGIGSVLLLIPYLSELIQLSSGANPSGANHSSTFAFAVREMIPPSGLLQWSFFQYLAVSHSKAAVANLANLVLLLPGYGIELGFFLVVFLIYLIPAWRGRTPLTPPQRSLMFIVVMTFPLTSFMRSWALTINDFGYRSALLLQFPLLLLGSELIIAWSLADPKPIASPKFTSLFKSNPHWLRSIAGLALVIGVASTLAQALSFRFILPLAEMATKNARSPDVREISHNYYIATVAYAQLDASISSDAVVQFNPVHPSPFWTVADVIAVNHQTAIVADGLWCGSELGGDPRGCPLIAASIDALYNGATSAQALASCRQYGIQYLVARIYDPAWRDKAGWVWTLKPVVSDDEFRALECRE